MLCDLKQDEVDRAKRQFQRLQELYDALEEATSPSQIAEIDEEIADLNDYLCSDYKTVLQRAGVL